MIHRSALALVALTFGVCVAPADAQKEKRPDVSGFSFVTGPKGDRPRVPGLNAVLLLTDEQKEKLVVARQETVGSEPVLSASRKVKGNPDATEADGQAARKLFEEAQSRYEESVNQILTPAQRQMIQSLQVLYSQARGATAAEYGPKLVNAKGDKAETARLRQEQQEAVKADFTRRVSEVLTPEQRAAFERAAAEEKQRDATAKPKSKG